MDTNIYFITWNTYGTWLPGDIRGWRKRGSGDQEPRPWLEAWCKKQMNHDAVLLSPSDRIVVEQACRQHCQHRGWELLAVNARTNHVHAVVVANAGPKVVRDQLKANCTRALRQQAIPLNAPVIWAKSGDVQILDSDDDVETVVQYVMMAQDRMDRDA